MSLNGKVALITGSTSGIGLGIAQTLASKGCDIVINGFGDKDAIEKERAGIEKEHGVKCIFLEADISKYDSVEKMIIEAEKQMGRLDILVNNAGIQFTSKAEDFPVEKWQAVIDTNLSGVFYGVKAALPGMRKRNFGRIINIASAHGLVASKEKIAYVAAKHGVVGLTKVVALETGHDNITCNAICPGWVLTYLIQKQIDDKAAAQGKSTDDVMKEMLSEKQAKIQFTTPEEIGEMVVYLSSDAAKNVTGSAFSIDGGWVAG
ncbi:MAG: 3-hydroxybutyrate dehydrogenase [Micavibrio aeruginosavorus]|uniref:3-hydroxybutyrate dehydrogenase n=1 Tax=Micavibrio aeruginosavorus TaxID=349221 RepID=A0A2W5FHX8_9BACT|nr:MAG: 3-hydroxybutyrate dehydrogenase [Micavibrio aeruginosavorus]